MYEKILSSIGLVVLIAISSTSCTLNTHSSGDSNARYTAEIWADNWFEMYINGEKVLEDSVPITTERSFNAEKFSFNTELPSLIAFKVKDFKANDTGLEYIGTKRQQIGDGGFIFQITDNKTDSVITVSNSEVKCMVLHRAPLDASCSKETQPIAGEGKCLFKEFKEPEAWASVKYDDSKWANAKVHSVKEVRPKEGYDEIQWSPSAKLIWSSDLKKDNTLICRVNLSDLKKK